MHTPFTQSTNLPRHKNSGAPHWRGQRLSALILAPLMLWFIFSALSLIRADHSAFVNWLSAPVNTALMALLVITLYFHSLQGMKVIVEDYIHNESLKNMALVMLRAFVYTSFVSSFLAIFFIAL